MTFSEKTSAPNVEAGSLQHLPGLLFKMEFQESPGAVILDVRTPEEFAGGSLPGAINIDMRSPDFLPTVDELDRQVKYFVICRSGNRSGQAGYYMSQMGFTVRNLIGGITEWPE
jgi:phage shock protein E